MPRTRCLPLLAAGLAALLSLTASCAPSEDESDDGANPPAASPAGNLGGGALPQPNASADLDPVTKEKCDAVWSFGVFVYSAHTTVNPPTAQRDELRRGVEEHEPHAATLVPELASDIRALAAHARRALGSTTALALPPEIIESNQRLVDYLNTTCQFKAT